VVPDSREQLWPALSNTDWINRSLGLPPVSYDVRPAVEGGSSVTAKARILGRELRWQDFPFEWLEYEFYRVHRVFESGPISEIRLGVDFRNGRNNDTVLHVYSHVTPRNFLGAWIVKTIVGPKTTRGFAAIVDHLNQYLGGRASVELPLFCRDRGVGILGLAVRDAIP
jgi:hypothetical protein